MHDATAPVIVLTVADVGRSPNPDLAARRNARYAEAIVRHGGRPLLLDAATPAEERAAALDSMDGLLLTGGTDIDPARYGRPNTGSVDIERPRDALEADAFGVAGDRAVPVLGICRGFQAINVFSGGTLLQNVADHAGPAWGSGPARMHPIRVEAESLIARLFPEGYAEVNTYHHQAVGAADLAPGLRATAWAASPVGDIVEAFEGDGVGFLVGIQCHPERTEFSPPELDGLFASFVTAGSLRRGVRV